MASTPPPVTPPAGGTGGDSGGSTTPAATFTFTATIDGNGVVTFGGTATGVITATSDGTDVTFIRGGVTANALPDVDMIKTTLASGQTLQLTAAQADGGTIDGAGMVAIKELESAPGADLSLITATTVTADVTTAAGTDVLLTGSFKFGQAAVALSGDGFLIVDSADMGTARFNIGADATLAGKYAQMSGLTIVGTGTVITELAANTDVSHYDATLSIQALVTQNENMDISGNVNLGTVDKFVIGDDHVDNGISNTLTMTAIQADGKEIKDGSLNNVEDGNVTVTGSAGNQVINVATTGINTITGGAGSDQITLGAGTDTVVINAGATGVASDSAPGYGGVAHTIDTVTGFDIGSDMLQLSGGTGVLDDGSYTGFTVANGLATPTVETTGDALISALLTALGTSTNSVAFNAGADAYVIQGNGVADGQISDIVVKLAGTNLSNLSSILSVDVTAPTASVTTATIAPSGNAVVQSSEAGTAYLVKDTVTVTDVASITDAADGDFNSAAITIAATDTNLAATGLVDGSYKIYTADAAGNLSAVASNRVTVDGTAPTTTITHANFDESTGEMFVFGTNFDTILGSGDYSNIKGWLDWSKFAWDINGDNSNLITFAPGDVQMAWVGSSGYMDIQLTTAKAAAIASTTGFGGMVQDKIDVTAGFIKDQAGNAATTDGVTDGWLQAFYSQTVNPGDNIAPTAYSSVYFTAPPLDAVNGVYQSFGTVSIDATNLHGTQIALYGSAGDVTISNVDSAGISVDYGTINGTANITVSGTGVRSFHTLAGDDVLSSSYVESRSNYSSVHFDSGSGADQLTGGAGDDYFAFKFADFANDIIDGGAGYDTLAFTDAVTLTDSQFANVSNLERISLADVQGNSIVLGTQASAVLSSVQIGGSYTQGMTVNAAAFTKDLTVSSGSGDEDITGGSGNDHLHLDTGNDTVHFAATAAANGADQISVTTASASLTLDLHAFLGTTSVNTTPADFLVTGLDLTVSNVGIAYNHGMTNPLIDTTVVAGKVAVADNGKAVVLWSSYTADASTADQTWEIFYVEDTDATAAQNWAVTLVGQVYSGSGATATEMASIIFA